MAYSLNYKKLSIVFFIFYLAIGLFICKDYGLNWDDPTSHYNGISNWNYLFHNDPELFNSTERYHGPALEIALVGVEKVFHLSDSRDILMTSHLIDFLFFYFSVIAFFLSARILLGNEKWALLACLVLVLSPRIFGDAFFNSKDIGFLSALLFAFYTLLQVMQKPDLKWLVLHCLACGFAIDIRILGVILLPVTAAIIIKEWVEQPSLRGKYALLFFLYPFLLFGFVVAFWPVLWKAPRYHLLQAFLQMKSYPWPGPVLYLGKQLPSNVLPWHYLPLCILITTPVMFSLFWVSGALTVVLDFIKNPLFFIREKFIWGIILVLSFAPVAVVIYLKSIVYDSWRHVFFIYPYFVLIAVYGFKNVVENILVRFREILMAGAASCFFLLLTMMIYLHPHENVYFNMPSIAYFGPIQKQFEVDYWGLSYKQGLEYLVRSNAGKQSIKVFAYDLPGFMNAGMLKKEERSKLQFQENMSDADFFITNHRKELETPFSDDKIFYEIKRFGIPVVTIYKLN